MNPILKNFHDNENLREAVRVFMIATLKDLAVERTFNGEETGGIQDARVCIEKMFDKLEEQYGKIKEPVNINSR